MLLAEVEVEVAGVTEGRRGVAVDRARPEEEGVGGGVGGAGSLEEKIKLM